MIPVFNDARPWGCKIAAALWRRGVGVELFDTVNDMRRAGPVVFVPRHHPDDRDKHKRMARQISEMGIRLIPSFHEIDIYDDKIKQHPVLRKWMPKTWVLSGIDEARDFASKAQYPMFSKTSEGAGSHNVRYLASANDAQREVTLAFGSGIPCAHRQRQTGYVYWQEPIPVVNDWRVLVLGYDVGMIVKRWNRKDRPMASGSGNIEMVTKWGSIETDLMEYARSVAIGAKLTFTGLDIVASDQGWKTLECTLAWPEQNYVSNRFFRRQADGTWAPMSYTGAEFFDLVAELIADGVL